MKKYTPFILSIASFAAATIAGIRMYQLTSEQLLWEHWPLVLFLGTWLGIAVWIFPRKEGQQAGKKRFWLATATGLLLALGFPPLPTAPILLFALIPLLLVENEIRESGPLYKKEYFRLLYHSFILWNIISTYWVANSNLMAGIFAVVVNSWLMCLPWLLFHRTAKRMPRLAYPSLITYWLVLEYMHLRWDLAWPWLNLGNGFASFPSLVQWYEYTGTFGGTLWILGVNGLLAMVWIQRNKKQAISWKQVAAPIALIGLPIIASLVIYSNYSLDNPSAKQQEVLVLQPNFEPHYQKEAVSESDQLERFLQLAEANLSPTTDYLVFPETSFGLIRDDLIGREKITRQFAQLFEPYPTLKIVGGFSIYHEFKARNALPPSAREVVRSNGDTLIYEVYNAAIQMEKDQAEVPLYKKSKLVPGAEFFPYRRFLSFLQPILESFGGSTAGLGMQENRAVFSSEVDIAPVICYESVFGEYHGGYIRSGADLSFIMTNDGWWGKTAGHLQHLQFASLRAIETRRSIARSANTGISAFINQRGDILQRTQYEETKAIKRVLQSNDKITFYVQWGDLIGRLALFLAVILVLNTFVKSRITTKT